ncbi:MAG: hypothetical protein WD402_08095, partial [Chloroflexota bacterium]
MPAQPRDPNIPDAFDVYTLVLLRRPADAPQMSDAELDALQAQHLAYRTQLRREDRRRSLGQGWTARLRRDGVVGRSGLPVVP